jgi:two-component sensor histidine kinase
MWDPAESLAMGLILTELVTNALKYGVGRISVCFSEKADGQALLTVEDEGNLPTGFDPMQSPGFGMKLLSTLLKQRDGSLKVDHSSAHTRFAVLMKHTKGKTL